MSGTEVEVTDGLRERIRGDVLAPGDDGFEQASRLWNGMIERSPALIVRCAGTADVVAALAHAREQGLPVSVRGGGHNVAGNAVRDGGLVIDLSRMNSVRVDPERADRPRGGGALLGDVDHETQAFGLATPFGVVPRTGIAGLTLHGGLGFLTRQFGLSCDNLIAADVVTADGRVLQADERNHTDLLWALRGGGGNFGVVTSLEYRLHEVGPEVYMMMTLYPAEAAGEGLRVFRDFMPGAPEELMAIGVLWTAGHEEPIPEAARGLPVFAVAGVWSGPLEEGEEATRRLREIAEPLIDMSGPVPFEAAQQAFDPEYPDGRRYYWKSLYLPVLDEESIEALVASAAARPSALSSIDVWALGGAMRREPDGGSAFSRRDDPFLIGMEANWEDPDQDDANVEWARALISGLEERYPGGTYLNFGGFAADGEAVLAETYGESYPRLQELKAKFDPDNVFSSTFNITAQG